MPKAFGQKAKLLCLLEIFWKQTDEEHPITIAQMIDALALRGISAERKSLYSDIEELCALGFEIEQVRGKSVGYFLASRTFELAELKLLVDAVQGSKFITEKKSRMLISKLESLVSTHEAGSLSRQVYVTGRIKSMNESIYYSVDEIHRAISQNRKITFQYFSWNVDKKQVLRREGRKYVASPFALLWEDENYYLIAFDEEKQCILHFRVDKMLRISVTDEARVGEEHFSKIDLAAYPRRVFGMFSGEETLVTLRLKQNLIGVILDRFGSEIPILHDEDGAFRITVPVQVSPQFFGWLASLGADAALLSPASAKKDYIAFLDAILKAQEE